MGQLMGMRQTAYSGAERGASHPRPHQVQALLDRLRVDHNFIYAGDPGGVPAALLRDLERVATAPDGAPSHATD